MPEPLPRGVCAPRISIITPTFNQGQFIEETIRSVIGQQYEDLEYIVIDGGSTDNTANILHKYDQWISYWISEPDKGQADAIAKGLARSTGEIEGFINSDDLLLPGALHQVALTFATDTRAKWLSGECDYFEYHIGDRNEIFIPRQVNMPDFLFDQSTPQPSTFWRRSAREAVGFETRWQFCLDLAFFSKLIYALGLPVIVREVLAAFRTHPAAKTSTMSSTQISDTSILAREWSGRYGVVQRLRIFHLWNRWRLRHELAMHLRAVQQGRERPDLGWASQRVLRYPPAVFRRQEMGALKRLLLEVVRHRSRG